MVYRKTIERTSSDLTVGRLARRDIRNPQLQACLTGPNGAVIREALCNTELNTFSLQKGKTIQGFIITKHIYGDPTLHCLYMHEIVPGCLNKLSLLLVLDYTGFTYLNRIARGVEEIAELNDLGFRHTHTAYRLGTRTLSDITLPTNVKNVSGDFYKDLTGAQREQLMMLFGTSIVENINADPVTRSRQIMPQVETLVELVRHVNHYTYVWMDGNDVVGVVQVKSRNLSECELKAIAVSESHRGRGIGRALLYRALQIASTTAAPLEI
ncbi:GNAT family N-acetyltransferase, partial [Escherichia coli]|uniref:GNAT family N-acetyltransferase n=1 Tax=Escherichia coli TaxID=562 RepID=UPI0027381ED0